MKATQVQKWPTVILSMSSVPRICPAWPELHPSRSGARARAACAAGRARQSRNLRDWDRRRASTSAAGAANFAAWIWCGLGFEFGGSFHWLLMGKLTLLAPTHCFQKASDYLSNHKCCQVVVAYDGRKWQKYTQCHLVLDIWDPWIANGVAVNFGPSP